MINQKEGASPMSANKVGTQLLLSQHTLDRVRALAMVRTEAQAEVTRQLIDRAVGTMEAEHSEKLEELWGALKAAGVDPSSGLEVALKNRMHLTEILQMTPTKLRRTLNVKG